MNSNAEQEKHANIIDARELVHEYIRRDEEGNVESIQTALDHVNLDVRPGQFIAILGHNGSGKSTLAKHINALLVPTEGTLYVDGKDASKEGNVWDVRQSAGMVFQNPDNQIIASVVEVVMLMDGGFSTGIQPLVSFFNGTGERTRRKRIFRYGMLAALIFGVIAMIATIWGRALIARAFNATPELAAITFRGLILSSFGFVSLGLFQVMCAYLQAKGRHTLSSILIYTDCLVAMPLALVILPLFFKLAGVWLAMPVSKLVMMAAAAMVTFRWKDNPAALIRRKLLITKKIVKMLWM